MNNTESHASQLSLLIINDLKTIGYNNDGFWNQLIIGSFNEFPPVFGVGWYGNLFIEMSSDLNWLASTILKSAVEEAEGVRRLREIERALPNEAEIHRSKITRHADDEFRHSKMFLKLFKVAFPQTSYDPNLEKQISILADTKADLSNIRKITYDEFVKEIIQINLGETKNYIHLRLLSLVMSEIFKSNEEIDSIVQEFIDDELQHIKFTALILDSIPENISDTKTMRKIFTEALRLFNEETLMDLRYELDPEEAEEHYGIDIDEYRKAHNKV